MYSTQKQTLKQKGIASSFKMITTSNGAKETLQTKSFRSDSRTRPVAVSQRENHHASGLSGTYLVLPSDLTLLRLGLRFK